jgi:hypothetical protein
MSKLLLADIMIEVRIPDPPLCVNALSFCLSKKLKIDNKKEILSVLFVLKVDKICLSIRYVSPGLNKFVFIKFLFALNKNKLFILSKKII